MTTWTNTSPNTATWTNTAKATTAWINNTYSDAGVGSYSLLIGDGYALLIESTYNLLIQEGTSGTQWTNLSKS